MKKEQYLKFCCTGCGLCHSVYGTEISKDGKGFMRPEKISGGGGIGDTLPHVLIHGWESSIFPLGGLCIRL